MREILGRRALVRTILALAREGQRMLVHGPVGIGKSTVLHEVQQRALNSGIPCGTSNHTRSLADVVGALSRAFPDAQVTGRTRRQVRCQLRAAAERQRGIILLDHLTAAGTPLKGLIHHLQWTGIGVVYSVDVETPRDLDRARAFGLTTREIAVPPLASRHQRTLLDREMRREPLAHELSERDMSALIRIARGRPGWMVWCCERLRSPAYWNSGHLLVDALHADLSIGIAQRYIARP
jgi:hypothetical protein